MNIDLDTNRVLDQLPEAPTCEICHQQTVLAEFLFKGIDRTGNVYACRECVAKINACVYPEATLAERRT